MTLMHLVGGGKCLENFPYFVDIACLITVGTQYYSAVVLSSGSSFIGCFTSAPITTSWLMFQVVLFYGMLFLGLVKWAYFVCWQADADNQLSP